MAIALRDIANEAGNLAPQPAIQLILDDSMQKWYLINKDTQDREPFVMVCSVTSGQYVADPVMPLCAGIVDDACHNHFLQYNTRCN